MPYCYDCEENTEPHACDKPGCTDGPENCGRCGQMYDLCKVCGGTFTAAEWDDRHTSNDDEDCHAHCCDQPECAAERKAANDG